MMHLIPCFRHDEGVIQPEAADCFLSLSAAEGGPASPAPRLRYIQGLLDSGSR